MRKEQKENKIIKVRVYRLILLRYYVRVHQKKEGVYYYWLRVVHMQVRLIFNILYKLWLCAAYLTDFFFYWFTWWFFYVFKNYLFILLLLLLLELLLWFCDMMQYKDWMLYLTENVDGKRSIFVYTV